jgi:penicillin G amidase
VRPACAGTGFLANLVLRATARKATYGGDNQIVGGSFKIIVDTETWDNSVGLNSPGQSGDVNDSHYRDLYELWARGKYFPIFYSRSKVESVAERTFVLTPSSGAATASK